MLPSIFIILNYTTVIYATYKQWTLYYLVYITVAKNLICNNTSSINIILLL